MVGFVRVVIGLIFVWILIAVTETAGIPILPRSSPSASLASSAR
ncbi:hypothetical protein GCM10011611_31120 [Aliidongia dinghuensis]|uniref:Uncharacterized protein n=1 Tax=Aliidongia dinghuensis TaxID=1867774 RepID=A0A8J2YVZ2_9PROT|nr:hypothetical protein [Aliidongia dinghuensis]GGF22836.1 hypothetical protein GCM10011611_31120 [Aliidongia dinghuensis]